MQIASRSKRFSAALIDYVFWIVVTLFGIIIKDIFAHGIIVFGIVYLPFLLKDITGQSPGKKRMKIKIISKRTMGKPNIFFLIIRNLFWFIIIFDIPFMFFSENNRRLIDMMTGTLVVVE